MFSSLIGLKRGFFQSIFKGQYRISFEIVSKSTGIGFYVVVPDEIVSLVEKQINGAYPTAEIDIVNPNEIWDRGGFTAAVELKLAGAPYFPIKTFDSEKSTTDPLSMITSAMSKISEHEVVAVQYLVQPAGDNWRKSGQSFVGSIQRRANNPEKKVNVDTEFVQNIEKKVSKPGFDVAIRLVCISNDKISAESHLRNLSASFEQFTDVKYNRFKTRKFHSRKRLIDDFIFRKLI